MNKDAVDAAVAARLPERYSQKAAFVRGVEPRHMWYVTDSNSVVEYWVFAPTSAYDPEETAVAMAGVGDGKLGYVGDLNGEVESNTVILAMLGLA